MKKAVLFSLLLSASFVQPMSIEKANYEKIKYSAQVSVFACMIATPFYLQHQHKARLFAKTREENNTIHQAWESSIPQQQDRKYIYLQHANEHEKIVFAGMENFAPIKFLVQSSTTNSTNAFTAASLLGYATLASAYYNPSKTTIQLGITALAASAATRYLQTREMNDLKTQREKSVATIQNYKPTQQQMVKEPDLQASDSNLPTWAQSGN